MKKKIPTRRIKFKVSASNGDICKVLNPMESLPGCEICPSCKNETLPKIKLNSLANGRMCSRCKAVVDRLGNIENKNHGRITGTADLDALDGQAYREDA